MIRLVLAGLALCAGAEVAPDSVEYYAGTTFTRDAAGKSLEGSGSPMFMKRTLSPSKNLIREDVCSGARWSWAEMRRQKKGRFDFDGGGGLTTGSVVFSGSEWAWDRWTYKLTANKTRPVTGEAFLRDGAMRVNFSYFKPGGKEMRFVIGQELKAVSKEEFEKLSLEACPGGS
ncbi:MAG TPA: hypothetical protein DCM05_15430 [Elusimicrobia bacterium]|nr:hypothetical protein [Elusimicrobiota bacterium]